MKNILKFRIDIISLFMIIIATPSIALGYHLECFLSGSWSSGYSIMEKADDRSFSFLAYPFAPGGLNWTISDVNEDINTGEIFVQYNIENLDQMTLTEDIDVSFKIVSDYDTNYSGGVDILYSGMLFNQISEFSNGPNVGGIEYSGYSRVYLTNDFGGPSGNLILNDSSLENGQMIDFRAGVMLTLQANMTYTINSGIDKQLFTNLINPLPTHFDSWYQYNEFFNGATWGGYSVEAFTHPQASIEILSSEIQPIPEASTLVLVGTGLLSTVV